MLTQEVDELISKGKYATAFDLLEEKDSKNEDLTYVLKKIELALTYSLRDVGLRMFSFVDLKEGETLYDAYYNDANKRLPMKLFPIDEVLDTLSSKHPENGLIQKELASYFFIVFSSYPNDWIISPEEILNRIQTHTQNAIRLKEFDYMTYYQLGYAYMQQEDYLNAITPFMHAYNMEKNDPVLIYNLALCYFKSNQYIKASMYAIQAIDSYEDVNLKSDAAILAATAFRVQEDYSKAVEHFNWALDLDSNKLFAHKAIFEIHLLKGSKDEALRTALVYHQQATDYPPIVNDILQLSLAFEKEEVWKQFFDQQIKKYKKDNLVAGILFFHNGHYFLTKKDPKKAQKEWKKAAKNLSKVYEKDHDVFGIIDELIKNSKKELTDKE
jgi:tetratricopeptide (TPR) repeat protein